MTLMTETPRLGGTLRMYTQDQDGALTPIPAEHAAVLALYRDSMPVVWEPQDCGDSFPFQPLIDVDAEPDDAPPANDLERLARATASQMRRLRLGGETFRPPRFEELAHEAARAYLADMYQFAGSMNFQDDPATVAEATARDTTAAGRKLGRAVNRIAREVTDSTPAIHLGPCLDETIGR